MSSQASPQDIVVTPQDIITPPQDIIITPQDVDTTCSQDLFNDINPLQSSSKVCSSTPINSSPVVEHTEEVVDDGSSLCDVAEKHHSNIKEQLSTISNCHPLSVSNTVVDDVPVIEISQNCNPSTVKVVRNHTDYSNTGDVSKSIICSPDCKQTITDKQFHNNSDLMDELFANHLTQITSANTKHNESQDTVLQPTSAPVEGDKKSDHLTGSNVVDDDSGCGLTGSDGVTDETPTHTVADKLHATPMRSGLHPGVHRNIRPYATTRKSAKQFKAPRLSNQVSKDEERKSLERLAKQFPSLASSSTPVTAPSNTVPCSSSDRVSCGFVAASGKKLTVSTSALDRAARLVEECSNETNNVKINLDVISGEVPDPGVAPNMEEKETELTDGYCAESMDSIDMDQFSAFTQMPGYVTNRTAEEVSSTKGGIPTGKSVSFTPIGSPLHPKGTSPSQPAHGHDEDSIHKMFNTQVVKQFLDFHSSDEDDDKIGEAETTTTYTADELASHTHKELKLHDARSPALKDTVVKSHDAYSPTHRTAPRTNGHNQMMLSGFTTAGGKSVMVSAEAVASVKKLLEDEEADMIADKHDAVVVKDGPTPGGGFPGLTTASGKKVEISSESLHAAQELLKESDADPVGVAKNYQTPVVKFNGFCTAAGSVVKVSEESIKKAKKLLDGDLDDNHAPSISLCNGEQPEDVDTPAGGFPGLSTASRKKVEISSESLRVAQELLREGDDEPVDIAKTPITRFNGFSTASGSVVKVSAESIKKAKKLLDEDLTHQDDLVPSIPLCDNKQSSDAMETTPANTDKVYSVITYHDNCVLCFRCVIKLQLRGKETRCIPLLKVCLCVCVCVCVCARARALYIMCA